MPVCVKCKTKKSRLDYFSLPTDAEVKTKWLDFIKSDGLGWRKESKLCSRHFTPDCFITEADQRILKDGSVPTLEVQNARDPNSKPAKRSSSSKKCILCGNNATDLSYFSIPKEPVMKEKWEKFCEFELGEGNYNLCHLHFKPKYVLIGDNGKRKLAANAIPSIYFDDYQFEFIPVDRNKTNNEDSSSDVECVTIDPSDHSYTAQNHDENSIISIDYEECNIYPRAPAINNAPNSISNDIVNIFIPSYEDQVVDNNNSTNNGSASAANETAKNKSIAVFSPSGRKKRMYYPGDLRDEDINSLEVAKISIQNFRKVIDKKSKTIKVLSLKVRRLQNKNAALKEAIRQLRAEKVAKEAKESEDLFEVKGWWDS